MRRLAALSLALAAAAGCTLTTDASKLDPFQDIESFCPVLYDRVVARFDACGPMGAAYRDQLYATGVDGCSRLVAGEQAGRLAYDEAAARTCIDQLSGAGCSDFGAACDTVLTARVAVGGACALDAECLAPAEGCFSPDLTCPGQCMPRGQAGDACGIADPPCGPAFQCDFSVSNPVCVALPGPGQSCASLPCRPGSFCASLPPLCQAQGGIGATCGTNLECDSRLDLFCDAGTCALPPTVGGTAGASCAFPRFCADGYFCDFSAAAPTCAARRALGAACTSGSQCQAPGDCLPTEASAGTASACQVPRAEGSRCLVGAQACARGLFCAGAAAGAVGSCQPWPGVGGVCGGVNGEAVGCLGGWCDVTITASIDTCRAIKPLGATCGGSEECALDGFLALANCLDTGAGRVCTAACR